MCRPSIGYNGLLVSIVRVSLLVRLEVNVLDILVSNVSILVRMDNLWVILSVYWSILASVLLSSSIYCMSVSRSSICFKKANGQQVFYWLAWSVY